MARRPNNEILYKVFQDFINLCLLKDQSLLWPDKEIWTRGNVAEVKKRMVDSPIVGHDLSFEEKLQKQMDGGPPELWAIISDIYYIYFLPSTHITFERKQKDIRRAAEKGNLIPPPGNDAIWEGLKYGFTRTAQKYHYKYAQFWFLLLFAHHLKGLPNLAAVIANPQELQKALDLIIENIPNKVDRAYDMRHAILYMAFPDLYERIISTRDKERIVEVYRGRISGPVPVDLDEAIRKIRSVLSVEYDRPDHSFDFYQDLKEQWKPGKEIPPGIKIPTGNGVVTVPESGEPSSEGQESGIEVTEHTQIQWMLLKLGNDMGLDVWVAKNDRSRGVGGQKFSDLPRLKKDLPLTFDEATNRTIQLIDVLWLKGNAIKAAFEIESTTSIYSGILRLADLIAMQPNINIPLYLVAPNERREKVILEVNRPVFSRLSPPMSEICRYISFSSLKEGIPKSTSLIKHLNPEFLEELSEPCEVEGEE
jgi:hypothetical protein